MECCFVWTWWESNLIGRIAVSKIVSAGSSPVFLVVWSIAKFGKASYFECEMRRFESYYSSFMHSSSKWLGYYPFTVEIRVRVP